MNIKLKKTLKISIPLLIVASVIFTCCFYLIPIKYHKSFLLRQTDVVFQTSNEKTFFSFKGTQYPGIYDSKAINHYEIPTFEINGSRMNFNQMSCNDNYVFVALEDGKAYKPTGYISIYNLDFELIKTMDFGEYNEVTGIVSKDNYLYYIIRNWRSTVFNLYRYDIKNDNHILLREDLSNLNYYDDGNNHLFFDFLGRLYIASDKTALMVSYDSEGYNYLTDGIVSLQMRNKKLIIKDEASEIEFRANSYNRLYDKAYIIGNNLVFGAYRNVKKHNCASLNNDKGFCMCGLKESCLFNYDIQTKKLNIERVFKAGTFLIDYDLTSVEYYCEGSLFINDVLARKCEVVEAKETIKQSRLSQPNYNLSIDYNLSFYKNNFYGI